MTDLAKVPDPGHAMTNTKPVQNAFLAAALIAVLLFLYVPSEIFVRNPLEFRSSTGSILLHLGTWWLITLVILILPVLIPVRCWRVLYSLGLSALALGLWVSSVFLVLDIGSLDGKALDLSQEAGRLRLHAGVFAAVFIIGMAALWKWGKYLFVGLWILAVGLVLTAANNFRVADQSRPPPVRPVDLVELSAFSENQNVLMLVLDSYQSDILDVLLEQDSDLGEALSGFVFFPDTLGVAPTTYLTMPAFHSGMQYDMEMSLPDFYRRGVEEGSFMGELGRNGYHVSLINPIASGCPKPSNICEYQEGLLEPHDLARAEFAWIADWSVFRVAPGVLKEYLFKEGIGAVSRLQGDKALRGLEQRIFHGNTVMKRMTDFLSSESDVPTAKLVHLFNTHPPFMLDAECRFIGVKERIYRHDQTEQTACVMKWTLGLFDKMKEQGVYDNTLIILTADTGMGNFYAEDDLSSLYAQEHGIPEGEKGRLIGGANPILAVKWPGAQGRLQRSATQAQLTDIPMTVCAALQGCDWSVGLDLKQMHTDMRTRVYDYYRWENRFWGLTEIPGITRYEVKGPLWLGESWTAVASTEER